ncbi:MAG: type II toxin-antitoxin system RelE/ParE family toxin [Algicola sp.]|nr:type II toxin-antitoxin system RelE/ParE family toxin [Algicola sp.]
MKKYQVNISPTAEDDITRRYLQIAGDAPQNALNWYMSIIEAIENLDQMPQRCPVAPEDEHIRMGIRHLIIGHYRILFVIGDDTVEVLHIRHHSMERKL